MSQPSAMPSQEPSSGSKVRSILIRFVRDVTYMPRWHKSVLGVALLTLVLGWMHLGYHAVADSNSPSGVQQTPTTQPAPSGLAGWSRRVGASVLLGFLIGWIFRTFMKVMASITALVLGTIVLLSYFNIANVDLTAAETKYKDTSSWVTGQAEKLRDAAKGHIHSTLGGALGLFIGIRKKMRAV
jgi:uncharacterized membrane protein (Fun14 family)